MKIAVIGATSHGMTLAAYLKTIYDDVTLVDLEIAPLEAIQLHGINVVGATTFQVNNIAVKTAEQLESDYDLIFIFSPSRSNSLLFPMIESKIKATCMIVSFQENLSDWRTIRTFTKQPVFSAVCHFQATLKNTHTVSITTDLEYFSRHAFDLCDYKQMHPFNAAEIKNILDAVGHTMLTSLPTNIKWSKTLFSSAIDRLSSALNCSYGDILHHSTALLTAIHIADEIVRTAKKRNIILSTTGGADFNDLIINSDTKLEELVPVFQTLILPHQYTRTNILKSELFEYDIIDDLVTEALKVDQPTPYLDLLSYCLHFLRDRPFHENIQLFEPLILGNTLK